MRALQPIEAAIKALCVNANWSVSMLAAAWQEPAAVEFYRKLQAEAYLADDLLRVLPTHNTIYVVVPKAASTRIRTTLAAVAGRYSRRLTRKRRGEFRMLRGPRSMTVRSFYRLATNPSGFRFSFVRNPYARALSCWANKFQKLPLVPGLPEINDYLARREGISDALPFGADKTLSFEQFVTFAAASASSRHDPHLQMQSDILSIPGIKLDFIGRMENYNSDFTRVLDQIGVSEEIRCDALVPMNPSRHKLWSDYYTPDLADRVYRAYQRDFDSFAYPRAMPS
jgi:hypothetical protein